MIAFQVLLLFCCVLLIQSAEPSEVPQVKDVVKPRPFFTSWLDKFGSNINRQDNYKDKYDELLIINQRLERENREQLAQNERLRDEFEKELRKMNEKQQRENNALKQKYEMELKEEVRKLELQILTLNDKYDYQVAATNKANKQYNQEKTENARLGEKVWQLQSLTKKLEGEKETLEMNVMNNKNNYDEEKIRNIKLQGELKMLHFTNGEQAKEIHDLKLEVSKYKPGPPKENNLNNENKKENCDSEENKFKDEIKMILTNNDDCKYQPTSQKKEDTAKKFTMCLNEIRDKFKLIKIKEI